MSSEDAKAIRILLDTVNLSQRAAALQLGITERTVRRYCSGEATVPRAIFLALHLIGLANTNEHQRKWLAEHGVRLAYAGADGNDIDVTKLEAARLGKRASSYRKEAKKLAKSRR